MSDPAQLVLTGNHVCLLPLCLEHVTALSAAVGDDPAAFRYSTVPQSETAMLGWVRAALRGRDSGRELPYVIRSRQQDRIVGSSRFYELQWWHTRDRDRVADRSPDACLIGYSWLGTSARGTACNAEAKLLMLTHAFEGWKVDRVGFRIDARNDRSRAAVQRLGVTFEGVRRAERIGADGQLRDSAYYSVLAAEWPEVKDRLGQRLAAHDDQPRQTGSGQR